MGRHLRNFILIGLAAVVGSALGRYAAQMHARIDAGEDPLGAEFDFEIRPQELVPGVVAAFRVGEPPWSWFNVPGWMAAFATNFAVAAVGGDLDRIRQNIEARAMGMLGLEHERDVEIHNVTPVEPVTNAAFTSEPPNPPEPPMPFAADVPTVPVTPPASPNPAPAAGGDRTPNGNPSTIWTTGNATPSEGDATDEAETRGFTPFSD